MVSLEHKTSGNEIKKILNQEFLELATTPAVKFRTNTLFLASIAKLSAKIVAVGPTYGRNQPF
jgi:hypothetical protein